MRDLSITYGSLDAAVSHLGFVERQLGGTDETSAAAAAAVGHDGLAERIRAFADTWDDNRERMREDVERLAGSVAAVAAAFRALDRRLAEDA